jgi:hypothetical protein
MIPGIETLLGSLLGGAFRLGQAWLETREKQRDRDHEHRMLALNGELAAKADERRLREIGLEGDYKLSAMDVEALVSGVQAQAAEARAAGGWSAALSATVRPITTYLFVAMYIAWKAAQVAMAASDQGAVAALAASYSEGDMAFLATILSFYFADRSLRRGRSSIAG